MVRALLAYQANFILASSVSFAAFLGAFAAFSAGLGFHHGSACVSNIVTLVSTAASRYWVSFLSAL